MRTLNKSLVIIMVALGIGQISQADTLKVKIHLAFSGELMRAVSARSLQAGGWVETTDDLGDPAYGLEKTIQISQLPLLIELSSVTAAITREGEVKLNVSVGDSDASASGSVNLPQGLDGRFLPTRVPTVLKVSGGDHASGSWQLDGKISIQVEAAPIAP
jgi:hypothetical protein